MNCWLEYEAVNGDRVGIILPVEEAFQEAKDALEAGFTKVTYLKLAGSRIKWFMRKVDAKFMLAGSLQ